MDPLSLVATAVNLCRRIHRAAEDVSINKKACITLANRISGLEHSMEQIRILLESSDESQTKMLIIPFQTLKYTLTEAEILVQTQGNKSTFRRFFGANTAKTLFKDMESRFLSCVAELNLAVQLWSSSAKIKDMTPGDEDDYEIDPEEDTECDDPAIDADLERKKMEKRIRDALEDLETMTVALNGFKLKIREVKRVEKGGYAYGAIAHGTQYSISMMSSYFAERGIPFLDKFTRTRVFLEIDGKDASRWQIDGGKWVHLTRPKGQDKKFTFFKKETVEYKAIGGDSTGKDKAGLIQATFLIEDLSDVLNLATQSNDYASITHPSCTCLGASLHECGSGSIDGWIEGPRYHCTDCNIDLCLSCAAKLSDADFKKGSKHRMSHCIIEILESTEEAYVPAAAMMAGAGGSYVPEAPDIGITRGTTGLTGHSKQVIKAAKTKMKDDPASKTILRITLAALRDVKGVSRKGKDVSVFETEASPGLD